MNHEELIKFAEAEFKKCLEIMGNKNADYSKGEDALRNFHNVEMVRVNAKQGLMVRIVDKVTRIGNLLDSEARVKDESVDDTLRDLANYSILLLAVIKSSRKK